MLVKMKIVVLFMFVFLFFSCEKEFVLDLKGEDKIIVLNSFFNGDEPLSVSVTKSMLPQNSQTVEELKNARVSLFRDGIFVENMIYHKADEDVIGHYYSNTIPTVGGSYEVEVEVENMGKVKSGSILPEKVAIIADTVLWVNWFTPEDSSFSVRYNFEISFNDPQGDNYYYFTASLPVYKVDTMNHTREFDSWQYAELLTSDLPNHEIYSNNALLFKDITFDGSLKKIIGTATSSSNPDFFKFKDDKLYVLDKSKLHIELHSLSKEAYLFCSSYAKKIAAQDDIYSEPAVIYTNIEKGLGIFAGKNVDKRDVVIKY